MDTPGKEGTTFKLTLVNQQDIMKVDETTLEILSEPIRHRYQWYWKILYYLTFGIFFWEYWTYDVKIKDD